MINLLLEAIGFGIVSASITAIGAMGFTLQFGLTNVFNIAYGAVMTLGAFAAYLVNATGVNPWWGVVAGCAAGAVSTLIIGKGVFPPFARRGLGLLEIVMLTLGLTLIIQYGVNALSRGKLYQFYFPTGKSVALGPVVLTSTELIIIAIGAGVFVAITLLLRLTRLGKALRAMSVEPRLARACGIPTGRIVNVTWLLSGLLAGLAGVTYIMNSLTVDSYVGSDFLAPVLAAAILGRAGSPGGAVIASLLVGLATEIVSALGGSAYSTAAGFAILLIVLVTRPSGVISEVAQKLEITV
ncbi:MAG: branched-chain amino acid ABC transporter permease [Chloroflexota bacterium]